MSLSAGLGSTDCTDGSDREYFRPLKGAGVPSRHNSGKSTESKTGIKRDRGCHLLETHSRDLCNTE